MIQGPRPPRSPLYPPAQLADERRQFAVASGVDFPDALSGTGSWPSYVVPAEQLPTRYPVASSASLGLACDPDETRARIAAKRDAEDGVAEAIAAWEPPATIDASESFPHPNDDDAGKADDDAGHDPDDPTGGTPARHAPDTGPRVGGPRKPLPPILSDLSTLRRAVVGRVRLAPVYDRPGSQGGVRQRAEMYAAARDFDAAGFGAGGGAA